MTDKPTSAERRTFFYIDPDLKGAVKRIAESNPSFNGNASAAFEFLLKLGIHEYRRLIVTPIDKDNLHG